MFMHQLCIILFCLLMCYYTGKRRALIPPEVGYINENLKPIPDEVCLTFVFFFFSFLKFQFHPLNNTVKEHSADTCVNKSNKVVRNQASILKWMQILAKPRRCW